MGIIADRDYLKHFLIHRLEFSEMHDGTYVNYFDLMEDGLLARDDVAYESVKITDGLLKISVGIKYVIIMPGK